MTMSPALASQAPVPPTEPAETGHFAAGDGTQLQFRVWPAAKPRGTILIMHGFAEHGLRYGHLVHTLVPAGWNAVSFDARGHGHSGGTRVFCKAFQEYTDDLARAVALVKQKLPGRLYLFGHSMGGLITLSLLADQPHLCDGAILSNPALANKVHIPGWKLGLALGASRLAPGLSVPTGIPPADVSRDPAEVAAYDKDPLVSKVATARWYTEFVKAQAALCSRPQALHDVPMLVLIGDGDRIIDPQVTRDFFAKIRGGDATEQVYPGYYHELINEPAPDRARVLSDVAAWLDSRPA